MRAALERPPPAEGAVIADRSVSARRPGIPVWPALRLLRRDRSARSAALAADFSSAASCGCRSSQPPDCRRHSLFVAEVHAKARAV